MVVYLSIVLTVPTLLSMTYEHKTGGGEKNLNVTFKCHEEVLSLQPTISPKRFDIFPPDWGMPRRSRCVQIFQSRKKQRRKGFIT